MVARVPSAFYYIRIDTECKGRRGRPGQVLVRAALPPLALHRANGYGCPMYKARIESSFAAAHRLVHYNGKCEHLHGHNYKVRLWVSGEELGEGGMLVDFGLLKVALGEVIAELDHSDLNEIAYFADDPSAERIATYIFSRVEVAHPELPLSAIDVFETKGSMARYSPTKA